MQGPQQPQNRDCWMRAIFLPHCWPVKPQKALRWQRRISHPSHQTLGAPFMRSLIAHGWGSDVSVRAAHVPPSHQTLGAPFMRSLIAHGWGSRMFEFTMT
jgi:hypothetical protein